MKLTEYEIVEIVGKFKNYVFNNTYIPAETLEDKISETRFLDFLENCPLSAKTMSDDDFAKKVLEDDYDIYFKNKE